VRAVDGAGQIDGRDAGVERGGVETGVAEQLLDVPEVGAALE
jgi:hypothetical protein